MNQDTPSVVLNKNLVARWSLLNKKLKLMLVLVVIVVAWLFYQNFLMKKADSPQYQTAVVENGTIVVAVSASGTVANTNNADISTQASGVINKVFVNNGEEVKAGEKIASIDLDMIGKQKSSQALSIYQSAKNNLASAKANLYTTQSDMFTNWDKFMNIAQNTTYQNSDGTPNNINRALPEFHISQDNWLAGEAKFKNQTEIVNQAQTALSSAWLSYQQSSSFIYAPISGKVSGLSLQEGSIVNSNTTSSGSSASTKIANIKTNALPMITVNLTEIDAPQVTIGNKASITFDALKDKTFTGKVISIDTVGIVSSGVTIYPTVILLDTSIDELFSNMSANANIITQSKSDVLIAPSSAIQIQNGQSNVRILQSGKVSSVDIVTGLASSSQTEIVSGLKEGDIVVVGTINTSSSSSATQTASPFGVIGGGAIRGGGAGSGGSQIRIAR